jgi:hypothetical protein
MILAITQGSRYAATAGLMDTTMVWFSDRRTRQHRVPTMRKVITKIVFSRALESVFFIEAGNA